MDGRKGEDLQWWGPQHCALCCVWLEVIKTCGLPPWHPAPSPTDISVRMNMFMSNIEMNFFSFHQTTACFSFSPSLFSLYLSLFFSAPSTKNSTHSCTKWMGLLCWSLFSSVESSSSLTSTTFMEGMSVYPSLSHGVLSCWALGAK